MANLLEADRSTIPAGSRRASPSSEETVAIHWVHPRPRRPTPLIESHVFIGRADMCQVHLEGTSVSRRHVEVYRQGPIFAIRDLGSTNGTYLNGVRLDHGALLQGDVLRVGDYLGIVGTVPTRRDAILFDELAPGIFGSDRLATLLEAARRAAVTELPVILLGETGVGKDLLAQAIHGWSERSGKYIIVDCASGPSDPVVSQLSGTESPVETNSSQPVEPSLLQRAQGGTLLLDEVGELSLPVQAKLRRVLAEGLGPTHDRGAGVRVIATSQQDLTNLVDKGEFRNDMLARLSGTTIELPPLRSRREDIVPLFNHLLARHYGDATPTCNAEFAEALCLYAWPRNIRELETIAQQLYVLHPSVDLLEHALLPSQIVAARPDASASDSRATTVDRREHDLQRLITELRRNQGNVKAAAQKLGFSRQRAYRLMCGRGASELVAGTSDAPCRRKEGES